MIADAEPELPEPQAAAIRTALLRQTGSGPTDRRALSAGVLTLLRRRAAEQPTLIAVDDAHWVDADSDHVLAFALRRLVTEPVGALISRRPPPDGGPRTDVDEAVARMPADSVALGPLPIEAIAEIVRERLGIELHGSNLREIHAQSGGNPFFALELARALDRGDERPTGVSIPVPRDLREDLVRHRLAGLSPDAREVLLATAALARPTVALLRRLLPDADVDAVIEDASESSFVRTHADGNIDFVHPLYRSAVYAGASRRTRHHLHAGIAEVVQGPEERARHLALAADAPDAAVAETIEAGGAAAGARGASASAAQLMSHAARLTPPHDEASLARRLRVAGEYRSRAGDAEAAIEDLRRSVDISEPGTPRASALASLASIEWELLRLADARRHFEEALAEPGIEPDLEATIRGGLFWTVRDLGDVAGARLHADRTLELTGRPHAPSAIRETEAVMAGWVLRGIGEPDAGAPQAGLAGLLSSSVVRGDEGSRRWILAELADLDRRAGRWRLGLERAREAERLGAEIGLPSRNLGVLAWLEAALGLEAESEEHGRRAADVRSPYVPGRIRGLAASGMLDLAREDPVGAHRSLAVATELFFSAGIEDPEWEPFLPDAIEACLGVGDLSTAEGLIDRLEGHAEAFGRPGVVAAAAARSRAQLISAKGGHDEAEERIASWAADLGAGASDYDLARTHLVRGTIRRRAGRKRDARASLDQARELFEGLGAPLWAQRASSEARRIGGRRPAGTDLTEAEQRVARLARAGRSNKEIADTLFMSVRTVEGHLSHVYAKLEIRSRTELAILTDEDLAG